MAYLLFSNRAVEIRKDYFSFGSGSRWDLSVGEGGEVIYGTICRGEDGFEILPGSASITLNGKSLNKRTALRTSDRIEWKGGAASFAEMETLGDSTSGNDEKIALSILDEMAKGIETNKDATPALRRAFERVVEASGAEFGYLLTDSLEGEGWGIRLEVGVSSLVQEEYKRKGLVSSTILREAIEQKSPVVVESLVGHPWERHGSLIAAKVYSVACLPIVLGGEVIGAVYLYTKTPGKSVKEKILGNLLIVITQLGLLHLYSLGAPKAKRVRVTHSAHIFYLPGSPMQEVQTRVSKLAQSTLSILIQGDSGTGKELIARAIHQNSERAAGPFVSLNCAAIPPTLIESTLFGVVKGAFTGADRDREGKIRQANGGTLFLDEIGDLPLEAQAKFLRVLQERIVEPLGGEKSHKVDFRLVAATHRKLRELIVANQFREDLYYRINGATIEVPNLKSRGEDIMGLAEKFLKEASPEAEFSPEARARLMSHEWPGNVRELQQVIARALALGSGNTMGAELLEIDSRLAEDDEAISVGISDGLPLKEAQNVFTREWIERALARTKGNRTQAAKDLGISERTLYRLLASDSIGSVE